MAGYFTIFIQIDTEQLIVFIYSTQGQFLSRDPNNWFEYRIFLLLDLLPSLSLRTQSVQLFTNSWGEKRWIHAILESITAKYKQSRPGF